MFEQVGRYQICNKLGEGAMAEVYRAHDPKMGRDLAVKILNEKMSADDKFRERFQREARAAGILSHPNIVTMFDVGEVEDRPFIAMELIEGIPLDEYMRSGKKLTLQQILQVGIQLADALDYAHSKGIIHRDIKPSNVIIDPHKNVIKIADFGIARIEDPDLPRHTQTTEVLGTPQYMSPEQVMGQKIDGRTDLFSTGVLLYQLLSGQKPFKAETLGTLLFRIATEEPVPLKSLAPYLPLQVLQLIDQLLKKDPAKRFRSGHELAEALRAVDTSNLPAAPGGDASFDATVKLAPRVAAAAQRSRAPWLALGLVVMAGAMGAGAYVYLVTGMPASVPQQAVELQETVTPHETASIPAPTTPPASTEDVTVLAPQTAPVIAPKIVVATPVPAPSAPPAKAVAPAPSVTKPAAASAARTGSEHAAVNAVPNKPAPRVSTPPPDNTRYQAPVAASKPVTTATTPAPHTSAPMSAPGKPDATPESKTVAVVPAGTPPAPESKFPDFQTNLKFPTVTLAKQAYRAKSIDKKTYVEHLREIQDAERSEILALKALYKDDKITKQEYKEKIREAKTKYE